MSINDGGPAFPFSPSDASTAHMATNGMSMRDWLAGQALAGLLANDAEMSRPTLEEAQRNLAQLSYGYADAMLAASQEPQP